MNSHYLCFLALLTLLLSPACQSGYLSVFSGYHRSEHQYLSDISSQQGVMFGAALDYHHWRRKNTGWFARGPALEIQQAPDWLSVRGQVPLYQWHKHQGYWLEIHWLQQELLAQLSEAQVFLGNDGLSTPLTQDSVIASTRQFQRLQVYWHESTKYTGVINIAGLSYSKEVTPAVSEISNNPATMFDGQFSGTGLMVGRMKDHRGLNFQWRINVASLDSNFSNDATQHRLLSKQESSVYKLGLELSWHYRYYLAPYWYLVPQLKYTKSVLIQGQLEPQDIDHKTFTYSRIQSWLSLRRHF